MLLGKFVAGIYAVESLLLNVCSREITNQNNHYAGDRTQVSGKERQQHMAQHGVVKQPHSTGLYGLQGGYGAHKAA